MGIDNDLDYDDDTTDLDNEPTGSCEECECDVFDGDEYCDECDWKLNRCPECNGRGKDMSNLFECEACDGTGFNDE